MSAFVAHPEVPGIIGSLLLQDPRVTVRQTTALLIRQKTGTVAEGERYEQALLCFSARILTCLPDTVQEKRLRRSLQDLETSFGR
jgi:hypothetical protein